jgi:hypothetical protein
MSTLNNSTSNQFTDYINLTELWQDGQYLQVGDTIRSEEWSASRVAEFCAYFVKYVGVTDLNTLHRFI